MDIEGKILEKKLRLEEIDRLLLEQKVIKDKKLYTQILKERSEIEELLNYYEKYHKIEKEIQETKELLKDAELGDMASNELLRLQNSLAEVEKKIKEFFISKETNKTKNIFLEIRAGTGGEEAALFAADLFKMYLKYCERKNFDVEIMDSHPTDLKGFKEIILYIKGESPYTYLRYESGVHRVQRIPITESSGRIHTSAVSVAVLPEVEEKEIEIDPKDLKIESFRASGHGGQYVNMTDSAVRITHIPTGIVVSCQDERSQHKNKAKALKILRAKLYEKQQREIQNKISQERKLQIGSGDRSEKIRTYNFPQNRVTDHRINLSLYKLDKVLEGELDEIIDALIFHYTKEKV